MEILSVGLKTSYSLRILDLLRTSLKPSFYFKMNDGNNNNNNNK